MDDLVLTGTLLLIAFFAVIIASILAVLVFISWALNAAGAGNYGAFVIGTLAIICAGSIYAGAGYYLQEKGWI